MEDLTLLVAQNLKRIRDEKKLSLDKLSELTGVSKSMLGQIERGDSSPTISTIWKISSGLKVPFTALLNAPQPDTFIIRKAEIQPILEDNGKYRLYPLFPMSGERRFEIYRIEIEPGGLRSSDPHPDGTQEFLTIYQGQLTIHVADQRYELSAGDAIRFHADRPHAYHNPAGVLAIIGLTVLYS